MSSLLVSGSIATDVIMRFDDLFGKYILPDLTHRLSVNFNIDHLIRHPWGAGHNIAYNLALLGETATLVGAVGEEFTPPPQAAGKIDYSGTMTVPWLSTATATIMTDAWMNQITSFYPGAIGASTTQDLPEGDYKRAIISPNHPLTMLRHLEQAVSRGMITFFDPGQPLSAFSQDQLRWVLQQWVYLIVNEYERDLFQQIADVSFEVMIDAFAWVIVTLGAEWSAFFQEWLMIHVPAFPIPTVVDPTWCGDAYRWGLLRGLHHGLDREHAMMIGSYMASLCIQEEGTMEHGL